MREPYATLFAGMEDDPILGPYLQGDEPDWLGINFEPRFAALGSGQLALLDFAAALKNVKTRCDGATQIRVMLAMGLVSTGVIP